MFRLTNLISSVIEGKKERILDGSIAIWNFTNRCNLSCLHCYSKSTLDEVDTLTTEQIKKTILEMKANGVKFIIFSGGEPLTRKELIFVKTMESLLISLVMVCTLQKVMYNA
jgi:MoaA/NifB/PqqE/SkfB family radical SAM enzyme